ncbi:MAG: hypothetical protein RLZZ341_2569, partial [Pseudomonadota bacterium]
PPAPALRTGPRDPRPPRAAGRPQRPDALAGPRLGRPDALPPARPAARPGDGRLRRAAGAAGARSLLAAGRRLQRLPARGPDRGHGPVRRQPRARGRPPRHAGHGAGSLAPARPAARGLRAAAGACRHRLGAHLGGADHALRIGAGEHAAGLRAHRDAGLRARHVRAVRGLADPGRGAGRADLRQQRRGHPVADGPHARRAAGRAGERAGRCWAWWWPCPGWPTPAGTPTASWWPPSSRPGPPARRHPERPWAA